MPKGGFIDQQAYDKMLVAYRDKPGIARQCSFATGYDQRTCRRAWQTGWPARGFRPIAEVLEDEQAAARARLHAAREQELRATAGERTVQQQRDHALAAEDAVQNRADEARMVRAARHNAMGLMAVVQRLLKGANQLAADVETHLSKQALGDGKDGTWTPSKATALFHQIASTTRAANESAKLAQSMERSLLGQPEKWVGLAVEGMTESEAIREIELAHRAAQRARARGIQVDGEEVAQQDSPPALPPIAPSVLSPSDSPPPASVPAAEGSPAPAAPRPRTAQPSVSP